MPIDVPGPPHTAGVRAARRGVEHGAGNPYAHL